MHLSNMHFFYDAQGKPCQVNRGGTIYNYVLNLQGDVVGLTDTAGNLVVEYKYDAWGKLLGISGSLATSLGTANPLRYRGYVYDNETGLYYLHSRYYDPEMRRFVSADTMFYKKGNNTPCNLYAYCNNNVINCDDQQGYDTHAVGVTGSYGVYIIGGSVSKGICWDDNGNWGIYETYSFMPDVTNIDEIIATFGNLGASFCVSYGQTCLENIEEMRGFSSSVGVSANVGIASLGIDVLADSKPVPEADAVGFQVSAGLGFGVIDAHIATYKTIITPLGGPWYKQIIEENKSYSIPMSTVNIASSLMICK